MSKSLRSLAPAFVVAAPAGARIRTRLRLNEDDAHVVRLVGEHLGALAGADLAARVRLGAGPKHAERAARKRALTAGSSSRWAGAITRTSADQWERALRNLLDERTQLQAAIETIAARLAAPVGGREGPARGYATQAERWQKQRRRQVLEARLARVKERIRTGRVSVVRGGRRLAHARHNLAAAGLAHAEWQKQWSSARLFLSADGEADKTWGNETIRVHPEEGWLEIRLPTPVTHLSNTPGRSPTYRLTCPVRFSHRADEWAAQATTGAVRYDITHDPKRNRWYLDASWSITPTTAPALSALRAGRTLGVDLNADHLAAWVIGPDGNPIGAAHTIPLKLTGPTSRRDGRLRAAISHLLHVARNQRCASITVENLNFADARARGREALGRGRRGRRFRATVSGIPTSRFRERLVGMAHNFGLWIIAVDPAYTSRWGAACWQQTLDRSHRKALSSRVSRHQAASVVIGRRGLGHAARRRTEKTGPHQRMRPGKPSSRPDHTPQATRATHTRKDEEHRPAVMRSSPERPPWETQATQHRSGPPTNAGLTPAQ